MGQVVEIVVALRNNHDLISTTVGFGISTTVGFGIHDLTVRKLSDEIRFMLLSN